MPSAYELNLEYGLTDPDELEDIGTEEERSEALISANLPTIKSPDLNLDLDSALFPPEEAAPIVPMSLAKAPLVSRMGLTTQPPKTRGPIFKTAETILSPAEQLNREYGLAPQVEGIIPKEISRPESPATRLNREMGLGPLTRPIGETRDTQEPGTPVSTIFRDLMVPVEPTPPLPPEKPGLIGEALRGIPHGVLQVGEIAGGLVGLAGEVTGIEAIEKVGAHLHKTFQEMNEKFKPTVAGFQDIESVGDAARYLGHGFMSMLPFMVGTFGVGAAIRGVVTKTLGKAITERAAAKAIIGFSSLAAASTIAETGIIASERVDEGMKAASLNLLWAIPAGLMDALPAWRLLGKLGWFGRSVTKRAEREGLRAARHYFIKEVGKQGFFEGVTESAQEVFEAMGAGKKPFSYETLMQAANTFIIAGFTGGIMGGAVTLLGPSPKKQVAPTPTVKPPIIPPDITRDPTDILKPAVVRPDVAALWQETVFPGVVEEPVPMNEVSRIWRKFLEGTGVWTNLDVKNGQMIIEDIKGGKLSSVLNPVSQVFELYGYTNVNGQFTKLDPGVPLPRSLMDIITEGLALGKPAEVRVEGVKKPRKIGLTSYSGRFVTAGYGTTKYSGTERITRKNYNAAYEQGDLPEVWYGYGDEHEVEPMFGGMRPQKVEAEFKIFDRKLATKEELAEFNAKQDEVAARLERKWGFNRNMPDQAQVLGYQAAKELGYDGLNTGRAIAMFHDLPVQMRPKEGAIRGVIEPTLPRGYNSVEEFTDPINTPLRTSQYAILTAANPGNAKLPAQENAVRNKKLVKELKDAGFTVIPVQGKYAGLRAPSFLVPEMSNDQALEFGIRHGQESVLVPRGLLYQDGSVNPANLDAIVFDNTLTDNYTEINIGGKRVRFSTPIDFETKIARGAGVTAAPTPPGAGLVPAATPFIEGAKIDLLHKEVVEPALEPVREVPVAPAAPPGLPRGFFEAVIMFDEQGSISVRPISYESIREGVENLPGFLGKVYLDAKKDTVYTPEMMIAKNTGEAINGIMRSKIESLPAEGFRPAFQELLPGERFRARMAGEAPRGPFWTTSRATSWSELIETEVEERGNYSTEEVEIWRKKYGLRPTDRVIWVSPSKAVAASYQVSSEEMESVRNLPEDQVDATEVRQPGFIIPESDDGDGGYLYVIRPVDIAREAMQEMEGQPMSVMAVQKIIDTFQVQLPAGVLSYDVPSSVDELPADIRKRNKVTGKTQALYDRVLNRVYIIADRHTSEQDVLTSISHELFAHFGFERLFGPHRMDQIVQEVLKFYGKENLAYLYQAYSKIPGSPDGDYTVAIEKIAEFAGTGENPGLWKRFVYWFRYHATKLFGPIRFSEDDIRAYLWRSRILIQQQSFQDQVRKYNAFVKLTGAKMWDNGLPIGPLGARFAMREDTSPSHESAAENFTGWRGWYEAYSNKNKNFGNEIFKRLGLIESVASLPHWISMNHPSFKPTTQVQWDRMDEKNRDRLYLLQDPGTNQGNNPYMSVDALRDTSSVDPLIIWSDRNNIYLESDENLQSKARELIHRDLTNTEIKAYRGWKDGFDRAVDYAIARLRQLAVDFYSSTKWYDQLKGVLDKSLPMEQVQLESSDAKDFQRALNKVAERMKEIDRQEAQLKGFNFYAPHVRGRGDHIVRVYDVDPEGKDVAIWVERFDSATQAEQARMRLTSQYRDLRVVKTLEKQTSEFVYGGLNIYAMEAFLKKSAERAVKEEKINEAEADTLLNAVFKSINDEIMARGFRQHYIRRQQGNIGGYREENLRQVFLDYMSGLAGSMAKLDATRKFHDALQSINKVNEPEVYEYASRYTTDMLRNRDSLDNKLNSLKTIPYLWYISMNLRLAATQMFQNGITAYPILSRIMQDLGVEGHASTELAKAMKDLAGNMTVQEQTMLQNAYNDGETMANFIQEIKGDISRSWAGKYFTKFVDLVSYPFAGMERFNRKSSLLAAFRVALRAGQTETEAYETAKEFVRSAHYAYGLNNFPQLLRDGTPFSKIAGLGYVFKSFPHNYVLSMIHYAKGKDGKLALGVLMRSLAMLTILGGLGAAPFIDDILDEFERQTGYPARSVIRKSLDKVGGPLLASAGMEGILALVGLDMSGSTKIQIPIPGVGEYNPGAIMMGVYGGLIDKGKNAITFAANNQWMRAVESAMPAGVESAIKSHRLATEGLRTATGKPILDERGRPIKAGPYEVAVGLAGFRPQRIAEVQKERRVAQNIKDAYAARRKKIIRRMRLATTPEERRALSKDIQSYNLSVMKYGKIIPKIGAQSIKQAMQPERGYMEYERLYED